MKKAVEDVNAVDSYVRITKDDEFQTQELDYQKAHVMLLVMRGRSHWTLNPKILGIFSNKNDLFN